MAVYLCLTVVVIGLSLLVRKKQTSYAYGERVFRSKNITRQELVNIIACLSIFVLLFAVSALRLNVGNDYLKYVEFMHLAFCKAYVPTEVGFNYLATVIYTLCGFENYLLVFAIFSFATVYFFLKGIYEQSEWFTISFILFMLLGLYFQSLSTVRWYLALSIAFYSIKYVINKDWPRFVLLLLIGSLFHKSLLIVLPLYIIAQLPWKRWMYATLLLGGISCLFLKDIYLKIVIYLYPTYQNTDFLSGGTSYVNIARCFAVLLLSLWFYRDSIKGNRSYEFYFICNIMALVLYVFGSFLPVVSRIGYYLTVTHILFIPALISGIKDDKRKKTILTLVIIAGICYFALYMRDAPKDGVRVLPYQTFLFHDLPLTPSEKGYY